MAYIYIYIYAHYNLLVHKNILPSQSPPYAATGSAAKTHNTQQSPEMH